MKKGTHGKLEQTFEELDFQGQSRSINGQVNRLIASIKAHLRKVNSIKEKDRIKLNCIKQLQNGIIKIKQM